MLPKIDLTNKCGSCCYFKAIGETTQGECLQNPYGEDVVHDPGHPYWMVQRSRIKCRLYNTKPKTNADRIRAMSDEELAWELMTWRYETEAKHHGIESNYPNTQATILEWLKQPAEK